MTPMCQVVGSTSLPFLYEEIYIYIYIKRGLHGQGANPQLTRTNWFTVEILFCYIEQ
jgi:hypothetical protein